MRSMKLNAASLKKLGAIIEQSRSIAFLGGAGVSTESGLSDFRSEASVSACQDTYGYAPQTILSAAFLERAPEVFFAYYRDFLRKAEKAQPNAAHYALARLEKRGKLCAVVTQNIDTLHERAGSKRVLKLHGSIDWNRCQGCAASFPSSFLLQSKDLPRCPRCGGLVRPEVVLYDEPVCDYVFRNAKACMFSADTLILAGSSFTVYPAASLPEFFMGKHLVIVNMSETPFDDQAELLLRVPAGAVFASLSPEGSAR